MWSIWRTVFWFSELWQQTFTLFTLCCCLPVLSALIHMQIKQRIIICTDMQVLRFFSRQNSETFDITHFFPLSVANLSTLKHSVFLAHRVFLCIHMHMYECVCVCVCVWRVCNERGCVVAVSHWTLRWTVVNVYWCCRHHRSGTYSTLVLLTYLLYCCIGMLVFMMFWRLVLVSLRTLTDFTVAVYCRSLSAVL